MPYTYKRDAYCKSVIQNHRRRSDTKRAEYDTHNHTADCKATTRMVCLRGDTTPPQRQNHKWIMCGDFSTLFQPVFFNSKMWAPSFCCLETRRLNGSFPNSFNCTCVSVRYMCDAPFQKCFSALLFRVPRECLLSFSNSLWAFTLMPHNFLHLNMQEGTDAAASRQAFLKEIFSLICFATHP